MKSKTGGSTVVDSSASGPMSNLQPSMGNMFQIITFLTPYSLLFFFLLLSIFTVSAKGILFLVGVVVMYFFLITLQPYAALSPNTQSGKICNFFGSAMIFDVPSFSTALYFFTIAYLGIPMIGKNLQNIALLVFLVLLSVADFNIKTMNGCSTAFGMFFGGLIGAIMGTLFVVLISSIANGKYLFYSEYASDKIACSVPKKQSFKCSVYKNGELLTSTFA